MAHVRLLNPGNRSRAKRVYRNRRRALRNAPLQLMGTLNPPRKRHRMAQVKRRRRRASAAEPHRKRRRGGFFARFRSNPRRRRRNPTVHYRHRRRSRNPLAMPLRELAPVVAWSIAGGVGTRAIPEMLASSYNTGWTGYALNGAVAFGGSMALNKFAGKNAGTGWLIGGATMLVARIVSDIFGKTLVTYSDVAGLSGDPAFSFGGYDPYAFPLPTVDDAGMVLGPTAVATPAPRAALPPAAIQSAASAPTSGMPREWAA
jgi:hypothetical protein